MRRKLTFLKEQTPLQAKLHNLAKLISRVGYVAAGVIFVAMLLRGILHGELRLAKDGEPAVAVLLENAGTLLNYFLYMVIIIVVAVPEGLPLSVTLSLALAMRKMTKAKSLVRQLVACETIGSATVICSDKTGTMTQNQMQVVRVVLPGVILNRETAAWAETTLQTDKPARPLDFIACNAAVNSTAHMEKWDGSRQAVGNSTERALLYWLHDFGVNHHDLRLDAPLILQIPFSSERKQMTTVVRHAGQTMVCVKGAPECILGRSSHYQDQDGMTQPLSEITRAEISEQLTTASRDAMRCLAFAFARLPDTDGRDPEAIRGLIEAHNFRLVYSGFLAIRDPLRNDVKDALDECRSAGIKVVMVTGDNPETARAIGQELGLLEREDDLQLTSSEFEQLSDESAIEHLPRLRLLARATPLDKLRLVKLFQQRGEVVAVTGDGTNDAPALKHADVGLAMGQGGSEVAKEASKIVLLDDSFATIVRAVHWGRALYENIQRFIQFQLTINISALAIAMLGPIFGVRPPFTILQLLWINVVMDTFAAIALCSEPPRPGLMRLPPKKRDEDIITPQMKLNIIATAAFFVVAMMGLLLGMTFGHWFAGAGGSSEAFPGFTSRQTTIFFTTYIFFQVWNEINCRSLSPHVSGLQGLWTNPVFIGIICVTILVQFLIVTFSGTLFQVEPLALLDWVVIALGTSSVILFGGILRRIWVRRSRGEELV